MEKICEVKNCLKTIYRNKICQMHLERMKRHGKYELPTKEEKFWVKVVKTESCWIWTGAKTKGGYGNTEIKKKSGKRSGTTAHRFSYELLYGKQPENMYICHKCDVRLCVNPDHLFLGTPLDNVLDMCVKGRHWNMKKNKCKRGHEFSEENTRLAKSGVRVCRACETLRGHIKWGTNNRKRQAFRALYPNARNPF